MAHEVLTAIVVLTLSTAYMVRRFGIHNRVSITGGVFVALLVMHGVSAVPYYLGRTSTPIWLGEPSKHFLWAIAASFGCFVLGVAMATSFWRFDLRKSQVAFFSQPTQRADVNPLALTLLVLATLTAIAAFSFASGKSGVQVLYEFAQDYSALYEFRMQQAYENRFKYVGTLAWAITGPLCAMVLANLGTRPRRRALDVGFYLLVVACAIGALSTMHKAPLMFLVLFLGTNRFLRMTDSNRLPMAMVARIVAIVLVFGLAGYSLTYGLRSSEALLWTLSRIFVAPQVGLDAVLKVYPTMLPFDHGLGIGLVARMMGVANYGSPPLLVGAIMTGRPNVSLNGFWSFQMWSSFGYVGICAGSALAGGLFVWLDRYCLTLKRDSLTVALYSFLVVAGVRGMSTSLFTALLSGGIAIAPVLILALRSGEAGSHMTEFHKVSP